MSRVLELLEKETSLKSTLRGILREVETEGVPGDLAACKKSLRRKLEALRQERTPSEDLDDEERKRLLQERGYELERLLLAVAAIEGMNPASPYKDEGEQIDGMLELGGRYLLLEARWRDKPSKPADIYGFQGKVHGRLNGTLGLFVSMNGFQQNIDRVLTKGKDIDIILCDGSDVDAAFKGDHLLRDVLRSKIRRAAQHGEVLFPYKTLIDERNA
jgi:hypothetical protein